MKKIFITMVAVMAALSMSAQEKLVVNTTTGSSDFYFGEQAKVSFWGQPKGEERNGDVTVEAIAVGTDYVTLRFFFKRSFSGQWCFHISEDNTTWEPSLYNYVEEGDAIVYGVKLLNGSMRNTWNLRYCYSTDFTVTGLQPNTSYVITPYAIVVTYDRQTVYAYGSEKTFQTVSEEEDPNLIKFSDAEVKRLCVENWDTNGDGELSLDEAAAVTDLGYVFTENTLITSFDELKYFTGLASIGVSAFFDCSGLTSVTIPEGVITIEESAFKDCI